jgi:glyoxylase-like metal-dependent hydrolase (beta-lactamase superfamily II)
MKRLSILALLVVVGGLSIAAAASQQAAAPPKIDVEKLRDNLFMLKGGGGNTAVFVTATGVVVVDTKIPGWGQPLIAKIKELTPKPVTTIINTHTHGDHVAGNVDFPASVEIVAHENTKANMEAMREVAGAPQSAAWTTIFKESKGRGLPTRSYKDRLTLGKGADQVDLYYFGPGHTNGDAWVLFAAHRIVHAGDIFSGKNLPLLDTNNGGTGVQIGDTLAKAAAGLGQVEGIITGHSTVMTLDDLKTYAEFNREFLEAVRTAKQAGKSVDDIVSGWTMPAKYEGYTAPQPARLKGNVEAIYRELK